MFPLLDYAYLGLVSGDFDQDAFAIRHFVSQGIELAVCQSFAKNFGLYCMFLWYIAPAQACSCKASQII